MPRSCAPWMTTLWFAPSALLLGCFSQAPQQQPTGGDFVDECRACQAQPCESYVQDCNAAPGCDLCVGAPFNPTCLGDATFRPLASCSCESCAQECGYMCPGGGDACGECQDASGCSVAACSGSPSCLPCLADPYDDGCAEDPDFTALQACQCEACEPSCVWQCDGTAPACAVCMTTSCQMLLTDCLDDEACETCFDNPETAGCRSSDAMAGNALYAALGACVCESCEAPCGLLFVCS